MNGEAKNDLFLCYVCCEIIHNATINIYNHVMGVTHHAESTASSLK